jgi:hypothetical protein
VGTVALAILLAAISVTMWGLLISRIAIRCRDGVSLTDGILIAISAFGFIRAAVKSTQTH